MFEAIKSVEMKVKYISEVKNKKKYIYIETTKNIYKQEKYTKN